MRISNVLIVVVAAAAVAGGAYLLGHAVDKPAQQLETVIAEPARAAGATADANLSAAVSAATSYRLDHGSFAGMSTSDLRSYDRGLASGVAVKQATVGAYCIESTVAGTTARIRGPNGTFAAGGC